MQPIRTAFAYLAAGLIGGFAVSALLSDDPDPVPTAPPGAAPGLERRIAMLEAELDAVAADSAELALDVERLEAQLAADRPAPGVENSVDSPRLTRSTEGPAADAEDVPERERLRERFQARRMAEGGLLEQLTAAGFTTADAQNIETRIEELRVEAMQSRYEALRSGETGAGPLNQLNNATAVLRTELGDDQYERFLAATGRPTRVGVTSVLASSPAETAGLLSGDEILAYGGERVFDVRDLNRAVLEGEPGEQVIVDVVRDGQPIQIVMPRGPLGISSGRARRSPLAGP